MGDTLQLALFPDQVVAEVKADKKWDREVKKQIDRIVFTLTAPMVGYGAWADDIPDWLKEQAQMGRLLLAMHAPEAEIATDAEACAYLMTASLAMPLDHDWTQIYLHVATVCGRRDGKEIPEDVAVEELTDWQSDRLLDLKKWIFRQQWKHFKQQARTPRPLEEVVDEMGDVHAQDGREEAAVA